MTLDSQMEGDAPESKRPMAGEALPIVSLNCLRQLIIECGGYAVTAVLPVRWDSRVTSLLARSYAGRRKPGIADIAGRMQGLLASDQPAEDWTVAARSYIDMRLEQEWGRWRALHRTGWTIDSEVEGAGNLRDTLADGSGAVLWGMNFCGSLVGKVALWNAGIRAAHLSTWRHGCGSRPTVLGAATLTRIHRAAEDRYLAERVVIERRDSIRYLKRLKELLDQGGCVSIAGERVAPRQNVSVRLFGEETLLATGAAALSYSAAAALLPVHVNRLGPGRYRLTIQLPIRANRSQGKRHFVQEAVTDFAGRIEEQVRLHPADWAWESDLAPLLLARKAARLAGERGDLK